MSSLEERLKQKVMKIGRKAFITHIDGEKLIGDGYETQIWVQRDIDAIIEYVLAIVKEEKQKLKQKLKQIIDEAKDNQFHFPEWIQKKLEEVLK